MATRATVNKEELELLRKICDQQYQLLVELRGLRADLVGRPARPAKSKNPEAIANLDRTIVAAMAGKSNVLSRQIATEVSDNPALVKAYKTVYGQAAKISPSRIGEILARVAGKTYDGIIVARVRTVAAGVMWSIKRPMVVASDDAATTTNLCTELERVTLSKVNSGTLRKITFER